MLLAGMHSSHGAVRVPNPGSALLTLCSLMKGKLYIPYRAGHLLACLYLQTAGGPVAGRAPAAALSLQVHCERAGPAVAAGPAEPVRRQQARGKRVRGLAGFCWMGKAPHPSRPNAPCPTPLWLCVPVARNSLLAAFYCDVCVPRASFRLADCDLRLLHPLPLAPFPRPV